MGKDSLLPWPLMQTLEMFYVSCESAILDLSSISFANLVTDICKFTLYNIMSKKSVPLCEMLSFLSGRDASGKFFNVLHIMA